MMTAYGQQWILQNIEADRTFESIFCFFRRNAPVKLISFWWKRGIHDFDQFILELFGVNYTLKRLNNLLKVSRNEKNITDFS